MRTNALIEKLAGLTHATWNGWMHHMFSQCLTDRDGNMVIPRASVERWARQMTTKYEDLPDSEKNSVRVIAEQQVMLMESPETRVLTCVYCGHEYPPGTPGHGAHVLTEHIKTCEEHPMRELEHRLKTEPARGAEAEELRKGIEKVIEKHPDTYGISGDVTEDLQDLLDRVDARDSLAHLEKIDELKKALALCVGALEHPHDSTLVTHALTKAARVLS